MGIDHVGLATDDAACVGTFLAALGMTRIDGGLAEDYGVACDFWGYAEQPRAQVEVVSPARDGSAIAPQLARRGPGLYHLALVVDELAVELDRLRGAGFVPVDAAPCAGARPGMRVAFLYASRPAGLLVELVEYTA
jgi:methylmalonyl-CoA/ethylmalonyl-CoA epimerase